MRWEVGGVAQWSDVLDKVARLAAWGGGQRGDVSGKHGEFGGGLRKKVRKGETEKEDKWGVREKNVLRREKILIK